jgi:hypothetical protein
MTSGATLNMVLSAGEARSLCGRSNSRGAHARYLPRHPPAPGGRPPLSKKPPASPASGYIFSIHRPSRAGTFALSSFVGDSSEEPAVRRIVPLLPKRASTKLGSLVRGTLPLGPFHSGRAQPSYVASRRRPTIDPPSPGYAPIAPGLHTLDLAVDDYTQQRALIVSLSRNVEANPTPQPLVTPNARSQLGGARWAPPTIRLGARYRPPTSPSPTTADAAAGQPPSARRDP